MDFNDYSTQKSLPWKPIALLAGGLVIVVVVAVLVIRLVTSVKQDQALVQNGSSQEAINLVCEEAVDPEACQQKRISDLAQDQGSSQMCDLLESAELMDNCYWSLARVTQQITLCEKISVAESSSRCMDDIFEVRAFSAMDTSLCGSIVQENRRNRCIDWIDPVTPANCGERDPALCSDLEKDLQARATLDQTLCKEIVDESIRDNCLEFITDKWEDLNSDGDRDGLTGVQEQEYGTDPDNSDTDGDSYLDGAEVEAGYDPNGSGLLE
ncbi:hypothetical protein EPN81_04795 [Patescibacteria group bacterium]|nr:MAG: hypothetical protein EPN81_04795 [Patescibacteria group bacterium]